jgi:hypothetical protein
MQSFAYLLCCYGVCLGGLGGFINYDVVWYGFMMKGREGGGLDLMVWVCVLVDDVDVDVYTY